MKRIALVALLLQIPVLPLLAAEPAKECSLCVGVIEPMQPPAVTVPDIEHVSLDELAPFGRIEHFTPEQRRQTTIVFSYTVDRSRDQLQQVEDATKTIVAWASAHGPFDALALDVAKLEPATAAYGIKRLSVASQGLNAASRFAFVPPSLDVLPAFYATGAGSYFDVVLVDARDVPNAMKWFAEHDPVKKVWARVRQSSPNALYDVAHALTDGATHAYLANGDDDFYIGEVEENAFRNFNNAMIGDYAYDATAKNEVLDAKGNKTAIPSLTFVRGEDLRSVVIEGGDLDASTIVSLDSDRYDNPRLVDAAGIRTATDVGRKGGRFLIGLPPSRKRTPVAISVDRAEKPNANITKEAIQITTKRGITVEEIIRNHQAYKSYQESIQPRYVALDTTKLRFVVAEASDTIEATIAGNYFSDPKGRADWVWRDFYVNGVKWKYGRIPELPLIQPEKVSQLPLDIHLTNEYRYELVRETDLNGYHTYEVRFEPPPNAPATLPLYRGTVWIDTRTWARIRISMIQLNLTGEVLSNEEKVDFQPFQRASHAPLTSASVATTDPREIVWLPLEVNAQQVISAAGRANPVLRVTTFSDFRIEPVDFETSLAEAEKSDFRMLRETKAGLRYLEKTPTGERKVKEGFDTARTFLLGGIHHDKGLDYPVVPLGGIDYFNFDLFNRGIQTNVFFAGVIVAANATNPNVANTRTNVGADFFGIAVPFTNSMFRGGVEQKDEAVKALPLRLSARVGHPFAQFGKIDVSFTVEHNTYMRSDTTVPSFVVPADTFVFTPSLIASYSRWGWVFSGYYDYNRRSTWKPWGNLAEYNPDQKTYADYGASIGKAFYLPKFQRFSIDVNYIDGQRLDRFSKYELGFFGAQRVHGVESGSVRAERATLAHLSYGFVFSDQFRLETFYDHALVDDTNAGYHNEPFQGVGLGGQTVGPWGTILRLDLGKTVGRNKQSGFVANVVFLKLF